MVERLCSGDNYGPDLLAFKQSFDLDFTTAILRGRGMLDSVELGQLKALPVWQKDWMAMMFFTGRAFYLHWFVENEKIPDTISGIVDALLNVEFAYRVLFGNPEFGGLFRVFVGEMRRAHLDFVTPEFWRVWVEDCLFRVNDVLRSRYDGSREACPGAPRQMLSTSSDGRMRYHAVELMRLMIGQIAEVVKASHFWDRFAMRVPRMRER
jgi:hypothetical protein